MSNSKIDFKKIESVLIVGSNSSIARAMIQNIFQVNPKIHFHLTYFREKPELAIHNSHFYQLDVSKNQSWTAFQESLERSNVNFDLVLGCVGILEDENIQVEKSYKQVSMNSMQRTFQVNAFYVPMLAKSLSYLIRKRHKFTMAFLSAMVGSIEENEIGGWYSYRSSKAAMNMFIKNLSNEFKLKKLPISILSIHPGTTKTKLSDKFLSRVNHQVWSAEESANNIIDIIERYSFLNGHLFKNWDGRDIAW